MSVRLTVTAANRSRAAARFADRRVFELRTRPPEILLPGANDNHDVKCLQVGHRDMSVPHSLTSFSALYGPRPWI